MGAILPIALTAVVLLAIVIGMGSKPGSKGDDGKGNNSNSGSSNNTPSNQ